MLMLQTLDDVAMCYIVYVNANKINYNSQSLKMQFNKTWDIAFDQIFKAEQILAKNDEVFQKSAVRHFSQKQPDPHLNIHVFQHGQLIAMIQQKKYIPQSETFSLDSLTNMNNVCIKKYRQSIYYGQYINQCREGLGIMLYLNGRIYQGNWLNNYKYGKGYEKFINGAIYSGNYKEGKPSGYGRYSWENGQIYEGEWENGMKNGSGIWRGATGDSYIGEWKNGKANGYGVHTWINGDRYQGQFKDCLKHGEGLEKFSNGDSYKGVYNEGKPEGYGEYYWAIGSFFKGTFKDGLREGQGVWKSGPGNSDRYQGEYKQDKKHGYGIFIWENGNIYKGQFEQDLREGYGEMFWSNGRCFKGYWHKGMEIEDKQLDLDDSKPEDSNLIESPTIYPNTNKGSGIVMQKNFNKAYQKTCSNPRNTFHTKKMRIKTSQNNVKQSSDLNFKDTEFKQTETTDFHEIKSVIYKRNSAKANPSLGNIFIQYLPKTNNTSHCSFNDDQKFRFKTSPKKSTRQTRYNSQNYHNNQTQEYQQFIRNNPEKSSMIQETMMNGQKLRQKRLFPRKDNFMASQNKSIKLRNNLSIDLCKRKYSRTGPHSNRNCSEDKVISCSTFFPNKINSEPSKHIKNKRNIKTSGGTRSRKINESYNFHELLTGN